MQEWLGGTGGPILPVTEGAVAVLEKGWHAIIRYLCKNRWESASDLAQGLSVKMCVSVTAQTVGRTLHEVNLYGQCPKRNLLA